MNKHLLDRLQGVREALMAHHKGGRGMPTAVMGSEREVFLREYLQKIFPAHRRFSSGMITDSLGQISGQVDIAIEYGFAPSFPMPGGDERLLLAESVAAVIEVKSNLASQWDQVESSTSKIKALNRRIIANAITGRPPSQKIPVIAVGYRGYKNVDGLQKRLRKTPIEERPDAALVIESGCFTDLDSWASGPHGLYGLAVYVNHLLQSLAIANMDLIAYVRGG